MFYIGCTKQYYPCKRKCSHIELAKKGIRKDKCVEYIRACNYDIHQIILHKFDGDQNLAYAIEQHFIDKFKPCGNTTGARSVPPQGNGLGGGHNRKEFEPKFFEMLGSMPDYKLAEIYKTNKHTVQRHRKRLGIISYAEKTGNNGKIKLGEPHRRWKNQ